MTLENILERLSSSDKEVLDFCKAYLVELSVEEKARNNRAEDKAQVMLNVCGVGATLIVGFAGFAFSRLSFSMTPAVLFPFVAAVILIAKSVFFNLRALQPAKDFQANEELVFDVQGKTLIEAVRYDIAVRIWLYGRNLQFSTSKLFYLHRAIRNFAAFILALLLISSVFALAITPASGLLQTRWAFVLGGVLVIAALILDPVAEKFGKMWVRPKSPETKS